MKHHIFFLALLTVALLTACVTPPSVTPPTPSREPGPTATPLPPRPVVAYTPIPADQLAPLVVDRTPKRGESLAPDGAIEVIFDQAMDQQTVPQAFTLQLAGSASAVAGEFQWRNARTLRFTPKQALPRDRVFDVILTQKAQAVNGAPLREPFTFRFATAGYLKVTQVIPAPDTADVETDPVITVMFNRPVVPLTSLKQMEGLPQPLRFSPEVAGAGEWLNTSVYVFKPAASLPGGVTYQATVAAGLQDISGALLEGDYTWSFTTAPPQVVWTTPGDGEKLVGIRAPLQIQFNQPMDLASVRRAFTLSSRALLGGEVAGEFGIQGATVVFTPNKDLSFDTVYTAKLDAGATSMGGGNGMRQPFSWSFTTAPLPEIVGTRPGHLQANADSQGGFAIIFNTVIDPDTVMPNVTLNPPFTPTQIYTTFSSYDNTFYMYFPMKPSSEYVVTIANGIADPYGNRIPSGRTVKFQTAPLPPSYQLLVPNTIATYDAALPTQVAVEYLNVNRLTLKLYQFPIESLRSSDWGWREDLPPEAKLLREWRQPLEAPLNKTGYALLAMSATPGAALAPGVYWLDIEAPEMSDDIYYRHQRHMLVVSELNLTLKVGPKEALVWATHLSDGKPVSGLNLVWVNGNQAILGTTTTDEEGIARLTLTRDDNLAMVYSAAPLAAVGNGWGRGISPWDFGMSEGESGQDMRIYLYTDRPLYRPGHTVHFKGVVRSENDAAYRLPESSQVQVILRDAAYQEIYNQQVPLSESGTFAGDVELTAAAALGMYTFNVEYRGQYQESRFQVAAYRAPEFEVQVAAAPAELQQGAGMTATVEARYFFGSPLANTSITWNMMAESYTFEPAWGGAYSFADVDDPYYCRYCWWWWPQKTSPQVILSGSGATDAQGQLPLTFAGADLLKAVQQVNLDGNAAPILMDYGVLESARTTAAADAGRRIHPVRLTLEASAVGPDNQSISGRTSVVMHPGPYYIGLKAKTYVGKAGEANEIEVIAVDWNSKRLSNQALKVTFYQHEWINTFVESEFGGSWKSETRETQVAEVLVTTDSLGEALASFVPERGGSYHVVAVPASPTPETAAIRSSLFIWVSGKDEVSWRRENHDRLTLISDKGTYQVGETAEILIPSPFSGPQLALITIEREGIRRYEILRLESNSAIYRLPLTASDAPNVYVTVTLVKGRTLGAKGKDALADFKFGMLPLEVTPEPQHLRLTLEGPSGAQLPGAAVTYTLRATEPDGRPAVGAEVSLDVVDKAVLSLQPRAQDILSGFYARRAPQVNTSSSLSYSAHRALLEMLEQIDLTAPGMNGAVVAEAQKGVVTKEVEESRTVMSTAAPAPAAAGMVLETFAYDADALADGAVAQSAIAPGVEIRGEFADTAYWTPRLLTDGEGRASISFALPDNLTTWVARGVGLTGDTHVGEATHEIVVAKPLMIRPVTPRFFVVEDRAQLAANVTNNSDQDLQAVVTLATADGTGIRVSGETPQMQSLALPAHSERRTTWWVEIEDVANVQLIFTAIAGEYSDASKPRLNTGPDGSLLVFRYTTPDIVGTAGQLTEGSATTEAIVLPEAYDERRGALTVQVDSSLAAGMRDGLKYLEHYEYECAEQTVSRFLPNMLTYRAMKSLGVENAELAERLPALVQQGLDRLYQQQNPDGGWGWWPNVDNWKSNAHVSSYVVFALLKARQSDWAVREDVLSNGLTYLRNQLKRVNEYSSIYEANLQAWMLYVLAEAGDAPTEYLDPLYTLREKLSLYARGYLAQALWLRNPSDERLAVLLSDINNAAILSATGAHWEENDYDWWAMNTDTRSTAVLLDTLIKLDPQNALTPNVVRWLMVARKAGIWETTQETAWAIIALTDWMVYTGELDASYDFGIYLNDVERLTGSVTPATVGESYREVIPIAELVADAANTLSIARTDGSGRLYYTAHLEVYQPVEKVEPADRGFIVQRRYRLAACIEEQRALGRDGSDCPEVREVKLGDVVRVDITLITPNDRYYVVVEDPLPAGGEAVDTNLATTSLLAFDPQLSDGGSRWWWWWHWYSRSEMRDEKAVLFAEYLPAGTYEYSYTFRATLPGDFHVLPSVAKEFYFPEVFGRSDGRLLTIGASE